MSSKTRGYALNVVMILSVMLVVLLATMLFVLARSAHTSGELLARKQTFFATDGMMRAAVKETNDFYVKNPSGTPAELTAFFTPTLLDSITPAGYTREAFRTQPPVGTPNGPQIGQVPNGAFSGMNANLYPIEVSLKLRKGGVPAASKQDMSATLAQISMFEFMVFVATTYGDWVPGPPQNVNGRVHANGDLCIAGGSDFCFSRITSAGRIMQADDGRCRYNPGDAGTPPFVSKLVVPDFSTCDGSYGTDATKWGTIDSRSPTRENGCTNCGGTSSNWSAWAPVEFANNALDRDMGVPVLKLPVTGVPQAQAGKFADNTVAQNDTNSRFLVDPVRAADAGDIVGQKYAEKADIRILDGVWYVPDPANPTAWPGLAIWSDHPGSYTLSTTGGARAPDEVSLVGARAVGQSDLRTALAGRGIVWNPTPPRRYSYYEVDTTNFQLVDGTAGFTTAATVNGIVSYGNLHHTGNGVHYTPGFWPLDPAVPQANSPLCPTASSTYPAIVGFRSIFDAVNICTGGAGSPVHVDTAILAATRSGFRDGHVEQNGAAFGGATTTGSPTLSQKILPMNFDVAALNAALADNSAGELGSIFCAGGGGCFEGRPFNGIVWIGLTWQNSMNGFPNANPPLWPRQGALVNAGAAQPAARAKNPTFNTGSSDSALSNTGLPYELCSSSTSRGNQLATAAADAVTPFRFPPCDAFDQGTGARPNAVRIINADKIDTAADNGVGISIVSNVPVYVTGAWNTKDRTGAAIVPGTDTATQAATPWVPAMVGGDEVYLLSDAWGDDQEPWDVTVSVGAARALATSTTYNIEILAGWSESKSGQYSGGIENFPHFIEEWGSANNNIINGSLVVGYDAVYDRWPRSTAVYDPPRRLWAYDTHLNVIANQPPGTPQYFVYATKQWARQ